MDFWRMVSDLNIQQIVILEMMSNKVGHVWCVWYCDFSQWLDLLSLLQNDANYVQLLQNEYPSLVPTDEEHLDYHTFTVVKNGMKSKDLLTEYDVSLLKEKPPVIVENVYANTQQTKLPAEVKSYLWQV